MKNLIKASIAGLYLLVSFSCLKAQVVFEFNALTDLNYYSSSEEDPAAYGYDEKSKLIVDNINFISKLYFRKSWTLNTRLDISRDVDGDLGRVTLPQFNLEWINTKGNVGLKLGSFVNPLGRFNEKQLSTQRPFVTTPLTHSYYINLSDQVGYVDDLRDINLRINDERDYGSTIINYGGYSTGLLLSWNFPKSKLNWKVALTNGASNLQEQLTERLNYGVISKLKWRPRYNWEAGFSLSHGTYSEKSELSSLLSEVSEFSQSIVGIDLLYGWRHLEVTTEAMFVNYNVKEFYLTNEQGPFMDLQSLFGSLVLKHELPFLPGAYVGYRYEYLRFLEGDLAESWDDDLFRHTFGLGYHLSPYFLLRSEYSRRKYVDKEEDPIDLLYISLTAHF